MKHRTGIRTVAALIMAVLLLGGSLALPASATDYDTSKATAFIFSDSGIAATEGDYSGYKIEGTALTINGSGTYVVSGSCTDGSITVKKGTTGVVLVLDGLTLTSADTAPIACNKSTEVTIVAAAGSVNTLSDSAYNNDDLYPDNENAENAVIKCKDGSQVTLCGAGTINVSAIGKNGVKGGATTEAEGEARLTIKELTLNITATVNDALKSDQELNILSGSITVSAADDGIKSDYVLNIGAEGTDGPTILVSESYEGIEAATLNIYSGNVTVHAADDGINAANSDLTGYSFACNIYGGYLCIDAASGDGIDSNGTLTISGGDIQVYSSSANDNSPLDSERAFTLSGGTVLAVGSAGMAQTPTDAQQAYVSYGSAGGMGGQGGNGGMRGMGGMGGQRGNNGMRGMDGQEGMGDFPGMNAAGGSAMSISAGDTVSILDGSGATLCTATALRSAGYVFFSSEALTEGETYTLAVNGSAAVTAQASVAGGGMGGMPGGRIGPGGQTQPGGQTPPDGQMPPAGQTPPDGRTSPDAPAATAFSDVSEDAWYYTYVTQLSAAGVIDGMGDGTFAPNGTLTWAQAMKLLLCAHGDLSDVTGDAWAAVSITKAAELGLCGASQDGSAEISRLDFCIAAAKLFDLHGTADAFPDCGDASVLALHGAGVIDGYPDGSFRPDNTLTRAEISKIIYLLARL